MSLAFAEPAAFYTQLFGAAAELVTQGRLQAHVQDWLRGEIVRSLNEALQDRRRAVSESVIWCVGRIASIESIGGNWTDAERVHRYGSSTHLKGQTYQPLFV